MNPRHAAIFSPICELGAPITLPAHRDRALSAAKEPDLSRALIAIIGLMLAPGSHRYLHKFHITDG